MNVFNVNLLGHPSETGGVCVNVFSVNLLGHPPETGGDWRNAQSQT